MIVNSGLYGGKLEDKTPKSVMFATHVQQPIATLTEVAVTEVTLKRSEFEMDVGYVPGELGGTAVGLVAIRTDQGRRSISGCCLS